MGTRFDKSKIFSAKEIELIYRVREAVANDTELARIMGRELEEIQEVRPWLLMCRCPYSTGSFLNGGDRLEPQPNCQRDTNRKSHGTREGIAPWGALVRTRFERDRSLSSTPAGVRPPGYGEWAAVPPEAARYLEEPQRLADPWGWRPWDGVTLAARRR